MEVADVTEFIKQEIANGFIQLAALNLKGRPASKDLSAVAEVWYQLFSKSAAWQEKRDRQRFQAAFRVLALSSSEWPNPRDLLANLPPPQEAMKLEYKHEPTELGRKKAAEILAVLKAKNVQILGGDWIHGQKHRSVDECIQIYAEMQKKGMKNE